MLHQKKNAYFLYFYLIFAFSIFVFSSCSVNNQFSRPDCLPRSAFCPENPTLETQNDFCKIKYQRDIEYLGQCGPQKTICETNSCNGQTSALGQIPFEPNKACQAMQFIQAGISQSPTGTWNLDAQEQLTTALKSNQITIGTTPSGNLRYFHFVDQDSQWIVFLGSKTMSNWIADIRAGFVYVPQLNMSLHRGFFQAMQSIYDTLKERIAQNPTKKIRLTGHSLGGAVATILALVLTTENHTIDTLITFGQPQITDARGALTFIYDFADKVPLIRFINHHDRVPFLLKSLKSSYTQFGPEVRLEPDTFAILPEPDNAQNLVTKDRSGLLDHQPSAYISTLNNLFCRIKTIN